MSWLSNALRGKSSYQDPAAAASPYLNQIPGVGQQYYNPFIEQGQKAGGRLNEEYEKMLNPTDFMNSIMEKYKPSEGYQYQVGELGRGIGNTAAAGGIAGTPEHQRQYGEMAQGLMSKDMQQYLQNALGIYGGGISGEQDEYGKGFEASGSLADMLAGNLGSQAGLAFQGAQQKNMNRQGLMNALSKLLATGGGAALGFMGGGAPGAMAGAKIGSSIF